MKLLVLDSSGLVASVAIMEDDTLIGEYTINHKKTHSQTLLPMLDEVVKMTETNLDEIDAIAIAKGPGSFTGLRIGSATAKGLGLALNKPIVAVPTVDAIAYNLYETKGYICPIMDARRKQVYTGIYRFDGSGLVVVKDQIAISIEEIIDALNLIGQKVIFLGDGVDVYHSVIKDRIKVPFSYAPAHMNKQRAGAVGVRGLQYLSAGLVENADDFSPEYLRVSQAERERMKKGEK